MAMTMSDEELSISVQKYEVLYDKSHKEFYRKDIKKNAWAAVAKEIGLENGDEAEKAFIRLRDKYVRARKNHKELFQSGTSAKAVKKSKDKLDELSFMQWLNNYIRPRQTKNNDDADDNISLENYSTIIPDDSVSDVDDDSQVVTQPSCSKNFPVNKTLFQKPDENKNRHSSKRKKDFTDIEKEELEILRSISESSQGNKKVEDEYDIFGQHIANKMRKMSKLLDDDEIELLEYDINSLFMRARKQKQKTKHEQNHENQTYMDK